MYVLRSVFYSLTKELGKEKQELIKFFNKNIKCDKLLIETLLSKYIVCTAREVRIIETTKFYF